MKEGLLEYEHFWTFSINFLEIYWIDSVVAELFYRSSSNLTHIINPHNSLP